MHATYPAYLILPDIISLRILVGSYKLNEELVCSLPCVGGEIVQ
jgi:hypothetical protein